MARIIKNKVLKFLFVGLFNTGVDFAFFNLIILFFKISPVLANIFSTSIAISISYFLNKNFVFSQSGKARIMSVVFFVVFTLFGLWVIQGFVITLVLHFIDLHYSTVMLGNKKLANNVAKLIASAITMVWNFFLYDLIIFKDRKKFN
jgi:putative flippase GtrA